MRPVERGLCPTDEDGRRIEFSDYKHARPHLITRMGDYCSYCEIQLSTLAVEHIRHKDGNPDLARNWANLLLACTSCNSTKGTQIATDRDVQRHLWPHKDATFEAYVNERGGVVRVANIADPRVAARARATFELVGLGKRPGAGLSREQLLCCSDVRYQKRSNAWDEATGALDDLAHTDTPEVRHWIIVTARSIGFWSVWMTVFRNDSKMLRAFCDVQCFAGTAVGRIAALAP